MVGALLWWPNLRGDQPATDSPSDGLPTDAQNVFTVLTARGLRADIHIVARAEQISSEPKLRRAGADKVVCPQVIGAMRVRNVLLHPTMVDFIETAAKGVDLEMDEYVIPPSSSLVGKTIRELQLRQKANVMVVAVKRADGSSEFNPGPDLGLQAEDTLILVGETGASQRLGQLDAL